MLCVAIVNNSFMIKYLINPDSTYGVLLWRNEKIFINNTVTV